MNSNNNVTPLKPVPKSSTTPLWQLLSNGREPIVKKSTFPVPPAKAAEKPLSQMVEDAAAAGDVRAVKWLTAAWMPLDPVQRLAVLKKTEGVIEMKVTFKGYERSVKP